MNAFAEKESIPIEKKYAIAIFFRCVWSFKIWSINFFRPARPQLSDNELLNVGEKNMAKIANGF